MNMQINRIFLFAIVLLFLSEVIHAQDLIKDTQLGIKQEHTAKHNVVAQTIYAQNTMYRISPVSLFEIVDSKRKSNEYVDHAVHLNISKETLGRFYNEPSDFIQLEIPVAPLKSFTLELMQADIFSNNFKCKTYSGKQVKTAGLFYRGMVQGDPSSLVSLAIFEDHARILISDRNGNYILGPEDKGKTEYILYNDLDVLEEQEFHCSAESTLEYDNKNATDNIQRAASSEGNCVDIYLEADFALFESLESNPENVANYLSALFNEVATLYANEEISIQLSETFIWDEEDPYVDEDSISGMLYSFRNNTAEFNGNLAALLSSRPILAGMAFLDELCNPNNAYSVLAGMGPEITELPNYSNEVSGLAHELGHLFGSRHTHECVWNDNNTQIDDCGSTFGDVQDCYDEENPILPVEGTIMSYCQVNPGIGVNLSLGFGEQPGDLIRERYNNADCLNPNCGGCPEDLTIAATHYSGDVVTHQASYTVTAYNINNPDSDIQYLAGDYVLFAHGFHATNGSEMFVGIEECASNVQDLEISSFRENASIEDETQKAKENSEISLSNYPNPFSIQTTIEYTLIEDVEVSLFISDFSGKLCEYLIKELPQEKGVHKVNFDAEKYQNGLYQYTLVAGDNIKLGKMIIAN